MAFDRNRCDVQLHFDMTGRGERLHIKTGGEATSIFGDHDMLATVVINLIDNALKYSPETQHIHIDTLSAHGSVVIQVSDRGIGIPKAELHKIGRRFFRASNAKAGSGTGLGLYSSRKLLAYHGGALEMHPREGGETAAVARVPVLNGATEPALQEELVT